MRPALTLLLLAMLPTTLARADGSYRASAAVLPSPPPPSATPIESLPPGLWFRSNHYESFALDEEPAARPAVAAIVGRFASARRAQAAARAVDRTRVSLGYPWVVANHDLQLSGPCREEIVVVAGLFGSAADALAWQAADRARRPLRIVALDSDELCAWPIDGNGQARDAAGRRLEVIHIEPTRDAPAYRIADLVHAESIGTETPGTMEDRAGALATLPVACTVQRGSVFAFDEHDVIRPFDVGFAMYRFGHRYAPARCGGHTVYVPVEHTMRGTLFQTRNGATRLMQITDVSCDSPNWDEWNYSIDGREEIEGEPPTFTAACAG